jgi:ubiquitin-protein ligase
LHSVLNKIDPNYKPVQRDSLFKLLEKVNDLAENVLRTLNQNIGAKAENNEDSPEILAKEVQETYEKVEEALVDTDAVDNNKAIEDALALPVPAQYRALLEPLRNEFVSLRTESGEYNHHYKHLASQNENPPSSKMMRLAKELAGLGNDLPCEHTNSIFLRVDKERADMMKVIICGSSNTPYAHGCFEFDVFCDNHYPNNSPKMNLMTTGNGQIRFNPNLYACGKVCLSLLGTWRGNATENWDPKISTLL